MLIDWLIVRVSSGCDDNKEAMPLKDKKKLKEDGYDLQQN